MARYVRVSSGNDLGGTKWVDLDDLLSNSENNHQVVRSGDGVAVFDQAQEPTTAQPGDIWITED